jgi:hypothetical protein
VRPQCSQRKVAGNYELHSWKFRGGKRPAWPTARDRAFSPPLFFLALASSFPFFYFTYHSPSLSDPSPTPPSSYYREEAS